MLLLLLGAHTNQEEPVATVRCPLKFGRMVETKALPDAARVVSALALLMVAEKARDDVLDSGSFPARFVLLTLRAKTAKARQVLSLLPGSQLLSLETSGHQKELEKKPCLGLPHYAGPTAELISSIFEFVGVLGGGTASNVGILRELGRSIGRIVFYLDCVIDYGSDMSCHRFNALSACYGQPQHRVSDIPAPAREAVLTVLEEELASARRLFGGLVLARYGHILESYVILNVETMLAVIRDARESTLSRAASAWSLGLSSSSNTDCCGTTTTTTTTSTDCCGNDTSSSGCCE
jgi:hypothetical protein